MKGLFPFIREIFFGPADPRPRCGESGCWGMSAKTCVNGLCASCCLEICYRLTVRKTGEPIMHRVHKEKAKLYSIGDFKDDET